MGVKRLDMHRPIPTRAHDLRQSLRIILIGLVELHLECSPRMPGVKASDVEPAATQFVYQPWRHRTGFDADTGILSGMPTHRPLNLFRVRRALTPPQSATGIVNDADRRQLLRHVQTNVVGHRQPPMVNTTGPQRPDRSTIGKSAGRRDYPMSTDGKRRPISAQMAFTMPCACAKLIELGSKGATKRSSQA